MYIKPMLTPLQKNTGQQNDTYWTKYILLNDYLSF